MPRNAGFDSDPCAYADIWLFSITDRSPQAMKERGAFKAQQVRAETGLGASKASAH